MAYQEICLSLAPNSVIFRALFFRSRPNRVRIKGIEKFRTPFFMIKTLFDNSLKIVIGGIHLIWTRFAKMTVFPDKGVYTLLKCHNREVSPT